MNVNLDNWDHEKIPTTNIKKEIIESNGNYTEKFLSDLYNEEYEHDLLQLDSDKPISGAMLYIIFMDWHKTNRLPKQMSSQGFTTQLYKIIPRQKIIYNGKKLNGINISKKIIENTLIK